MTPLRPALHGGAMIAELSPVLGLCLHVFMPVRGSQGRIETGLSTFHGDENSLIFFLNFPCWIFETRVCMVWVKFITATKRETGKEGFPHQKANIADHYYSVNMAFGYEKSRNHFWLLFWASEHDEIPSPWFQAFSQIPWLNFPSLVPDWKIETHFPGFPAGNISNK